VRREAGRQQGCPQAHPSLHCARTSGAGHATLQFPVDTQCTRHVPWQVTSQLAVDEQVTVLASPTTGAQSLTLVQV
jgi:hypothetical protein